MSGPARTAIASNSLALRLAGAALAWLAILLVVGGIVLALAFRAAVEQEFGYRLDAILKTIAASVEVAPGGELAMTRPLGDPRFDRLYSGWYWQVTEPDGHQLRSRSLWDGALSTASGGPDMQVRHAQGPKGENLLVVERDLQFAGQQRPSHLLVAGDVREVSGGVQRFDLLLALSLGLLGLGMIVAIVIQVRYGLRPLRAMLADLHAVRAGEAPRLTGRYPSEVTPLSDAMNGVLDRDAELIERARTHVGNLAHALKTPLAVIAAELQATADKAAIADQVRVMRRMIEHHLGRARATAGGGPFPGIKVAVRDVALRLSEVLTKVYGERGLSIEVDIAGGIVFRGHREDLEEILGNLMENACKWGRQRVRVSARPESGRLALRVEDDGPGLSAEQAGQLVGRGQRFDEASPGWGLGLAIVSDLVAVNGGDMTFSRSDLGGLCVAIALPNG